MTVRMFAWHNPFWARNDGEWTVSVVSSRHLQSVAEGNAKLTLRVLRFVSSVCNVSGTVGGRNPRST